MGCEYNGPKVCDKETFIKKALWKHGNTYDYSKVNYCKSSEKVEILCHDHGSFWQKPSKHLYGRGCPSCGILSRSNKQRRSKEDFIRLCREVHGGRYDYSESDYKNVDKKVKIICPDHGEFWQTPHAHIFRGYKCLKCSVQENTDRMRKPLEDYVNQAKGVHGDKYDYSLVDYNTTHEKVKIICPKHGAFEQVAKSHIMGHGCRQCAIEEGGWTHTQELYRSDELTSNIYILKLINTSTKEEFLKVGLSLNPELRHRQIANESGYEVYLLYKMEGTGKRLYATEREVLFRSNLSKHTPQISFGGHSECLKSGQTKEIILFIENFYKNWSEDNV